MDIVGKRRELKGGKENEKGEKGRRETVRLRR